VNCFTNYQLPITNYQLPITNYQLPITNYQSKIELCLQQTYQIPGFPGSMLRAVSSSKM
ncbi:MAG: hypothetical protein HC849_24085, partial [Oscillatoriales cyanobacterium RU_3_3]|nr:hypothetical protein [Oscillatoriales cyanobacterium RU_3_3]